MTKVILLILFAGLIGHCCCEAANEETVTETVEPDLGASREALRTDDDVVRREEEAIKIDGLNVAQIKELREKAEKFHFQAEVNRMMKLIINSLYRNKEIFLRELISNAADALDKIRLLSLTDQSALDTNPELSIKIKADKDNHVLHIIDSGIGMTKQDLINNLGTIAKSGTAEFLAKMQEAHSASDFNDMIGQFGVGFYSAFLVANRVVVTSKHNDDDQYIWESNADSFSIMKDPRGNTLRRGSQISLHLKEEAYDFLEQDTIKNLVQKYSQFINFPISLWSSKTVKVEEPVEDETPKDEKQTESKEDEAGVEEEKESKSEVVEKTVWDWEILNDSKPIWTRKWVTMKLPSEIEESEYINFYKSLTKDKSEPLAKSHFVAEGEVTFKSLLFVPPTQPTESFNRYGAKHDSIKLYVRRVFITDEFNDMMPNYLAFIQGVIDSDDLPLNVSRETLQQHKLIKIIKKKLVRKALDMIKALNKEDYEKFWKEYSTNIKLGVIEDSLNRTRLAKLLMFQSSAVDGMTRLADYASRMKPNQKHIYYIAGSSRKEVEKSPFVERLLKKGYEVLYLVEAVDEYCLSAIPEFDGHRFMNVAKEDFSLPDDKSNHKHLTEKFQPLLNWLSKTALKDHISKALVSERLSDSPCALVASVFGWTGNMERLALSNAHQKSVDAQRNYYLGQKKALEINPRHPLIQEMLRRVVDDENDKTAKEIALLMFRTATLRSGYILNDSAEFAASVEALMRQALGVPLDAEPEEEEEMESDAGDQEDGKEQEMEAENVEDHDEL